MSRYEVFNTTFLLIRLLYMSDNYISSTFLYVIPIFL
nr:MAG TPA: hypothetical protein [Caudoviricetes sp.]